MSAKPTRIATEPSLVYFADAAVEALEAGKTLPAKFRRIIKKFKLKSRVRGKRVAIKMHFGGDIGYSTIHPIFVKILVDELKSAGATKITATDNRVSDGFMRGYIPEIIGCDVASTIGSTGKYLHREKIGFKKLDYADFGGEAVDCDFFIDLSHVKGHGSCGFGGAIKNIGMGVIPHSTRTKIHQLEGGIVYDDSKCSLCHKCEDACPNNAISFTTEGDKRSVFFHNCTYCQHCVLICPEEALTMDDMRFEDFSKSLALVTAKFLEKFSADDLLFINFLTDITIFCDCWGTTTPSLVPDIGIMASDDIVAIETASLDLIKTENLLPNGMPKNRELLDCDGHLFEKIHGRDPYLAIRYVEEAYGGTSEYRVKQVR